MKNNGGMVVIDREGGSFDWGNSSLLMFRKEDLPSCKKGGKAKMLFVWIDLESDCPSFWWFAGRTFLRNNCVTACFQVPTIPRVRPLRARKLDMSAPTIARSGSGKLVGESERDSQKKFSRRQVYISHFSRQRGVHYCNSASDSPAHAPFPCVKE
jgi:hypothetical protein